MNEKKGICLTAVYPQAMYDSGLLKELLEKTAVQGIFNCVEFYFEGKAGEEEEIRKLLGKKESVFRFSGRISYEKGRCGYYQPG